MSEEVVELPVACCPECYQSHAPSELAELERGERGSYVCECGELLFVDDELAGQVTYYPADKYRRLYPHTARESFELKPAKWLLRSWSSLRRERAKQLGWFAVVTMLIVFTTIAIMLWVLPAAGW